MRPLRDVIVVDVSEGAQGPVAGSLLGDLGAQVWKVERPGGEFMRRIGPFRGNEALPILHTAHARSACVELDLKLEDDRETLLRMVERADVFLENWRPGTADRLGLGVADMAAAGFRDLVYVSGTGYGLTGPMSSLGSLDQLGQAASGTWHLSGPSGGEGERFRGALLDLISGFIACEATLLGLASRTAAPDGGPFHIEVSQLASGLALAEPELMLEQARGAIAPTGSSSRFFAPSGAYLSADEHWLALDVTTDEQWQLLRSRLGVSELGEDRFETNPLRMRHRTELDRILAGVFGRDPRDRLLRRLDGVPITAVMRRPDAATAREHPFYRRALETLRHRDGRDLVRPRTPWAFAGGETTAGPPAPPVGQDNDRISDLLTVGRHTP